MSKEQPRITNGIMSKELYAYMKQFPNNKVPGTIPHALSKDFEKYLDNQNTPDQSTDPCGNLNQKTDYP